MTDLETLLRRWDSDEVVRAQWDSILQSDAWKLVSKIAELTATTSAIAFARGEPDFVLARNLASERGSIATIELMKTINIPTPKVEQEEIPYSHIIPEKYQK